MQAHPGSEQKSRINGRIRLGIIGFTPPVRQNPPLLRVVHRMNEGVSQNKEHGQTPRICVSPQNKYNVGAEILMGD